MLNQALFYFLNDYDLLYPYNCLNLWRFHDGKDSAAGLLNPYSFCAHKKERMTY